MNQEQKFFVCRHCGNLMELIINSGVPVVCCGEKMKELVANTVDADYEKHVPVFEIQGNKISVKIGSTEHPMTQEHHIKLIYLETQNGGQRKSIKINEPHKAEFVFVDDKPLAVYTYCNKHGLWKTEI